MPITFRYPPTFGCHRKRKTKNEKPNVTANQRQITGEEPVRSGHKPLCPMPSSADSNSLQKLYFDTGIIHYSSCKPVEIEVQNTETEVRHGRNAQPIPKRCSRQRSESPLEFYYASKPYKKPFTPAPFTVIQGVPLSDEAMKFLAKCSRRSGIPVRTFLRKYIPKQLPKVLRDAEDVQRCINAVDKINRDWQST